MRILSEQSMHHHTADLEKDNIDIKKLINSLTDKWYWFLISVTFCLALSIFYVWYVAPSYQISARMLVNDDEKGGGMGKQAGALMDLGGLLGSKNSVDNESEILKTRFLMERVVREMELNIVYGYKSGLRSRELYRSPFKLLLVNSVDTIKATRLKIRAVGSNKFNVKAKDFEKEVLWNQEFKVKDVGVLKITPEPYVALKAEEYYVNVSSIDERVAALMDDLTVGVTNKQVSIIDLGLAYPLPKKGEDILNMLISKYVQANLGDKNSIADSTYKFIHERINIIASELGDVENKVQSFKQNNRLADMSEQSKLLVQNTGEFTTELAKAETQVSVLTDLEGYLKDETKNKRVFPTSLLPSDLVFSDLLAQYNTLLIDRDKQLLSVTENSPFIKNIDDQIYNLRRGILSNIASTKNTYVLTRDKLKTQLSKIEGQIGGVPQIEKNYLQLARNQQIKQELYVFLMQKAEETAISKASNISVAKTIDPPKSKVNPVAPKTGASIGIAFVLGLIFPTCLIFIKEFLNNTINTKEDISDRTDVPIIGEISHNNTADNMVVASSGRSAIAEQFRALRTNLSFYLKAPNQNTILFTSSVSGEGKSFTAINLGHIFALTGKKVLLMEMDLRKPGLSIKLDVKNDRGLSNYTIDEKLTSAEIIKPLNIHPNLFLISSGPIPPNPAEILMSDRTSALLGELKQKFDYIIMDAPPIGVVTDAQLLADYTDVSIYMIRQGISLKDHVNIVNDLYRSGKLNNLSIVVNDIKSKAYGYGYGYGSYGEDLPLTFFDKIRNKIRRN